eukprot:CAMPEP_0202896436 /NCGR_PEP_ID=MMETSP1392-20130828/5445_1 /ASSEMBLY_ACC=CAM_ASM_000868 /TAXON_ID=225041 /ORGANISM="Chlamydomonas chlamydogama, Strain SAG 11-48b" /LENGTH=565 /DNA_ID=CAMNT_0049581799 /DNA_START=114 /DNA_END=1811 /DNA_ORIENTATION=-
MLSGFLGAGKTTVLRYVLENSKEKIACIVNDVASINIDAKLVRNDNMRARGEQTNTTADLTDTIELQNGCACCNLQDELFTSFEKILALADRRGEPYARIVLENSGVAEPQNIRDKFNEAAAAGHPLMQRLELDTLVTVVDAGGFIKEYASRTPLAARPDLGEGGNLRPVVDLLVEQVECADYVVLNKTDMLADEEKQAQLVAIVSSLNPLATVIPCTQGKVPIEVVFGSQAHGVVAKLNTEGQHRGAVAAAKAAQQASEHKHDHKHKHEHKHDHAADGKEHDGCKACEHEHDHDHHHHHHDHKDEHKHDHEADGKEHEGCKACEHEHHHHDHHDHDHKHDHKHDHDHEGHSHDDCAACREEGEHGHHHHHHHHGHSHSERPSQTTAASRFGIRSFVYSRRKPFHPQRLKEMVLKWLPVTHNQAIDGEAPAVGDTPIKTVLRSKGFMWMSNSHTTAYYWSHAGQHFEIRDEGDWWSAVPEEDWPEEEAQRNVVLQDFDVSTDFGDRRQEIVFIGVGMEEDKICAQLDGALLTDEEMAMYMKRWASVPDPAHPALEALKQAKRKST